MKLVTRYVSAQFLRIYALCVIGLVSALVVVELFETIDELLRHNPGWGAVASFFALRIPQHYMEVTPVAALLASIISLGILSRHSEIIAFRSVGIGLPRIAGPVLAMGLILSLVTIVANEMLVPYTNQKAAMIRQTVIERRPVQTVRQNKVWFRGPDQTLMHVGLVSPDEDALYDVHLYQMSPEMKMLRRVDARELRWENGQWFLAGGREYLLMPTGAYQTRPLVRTPVPLREKPADFRKAETRPDQMSYTELHEYRDRLMRGGYPFVRADVDFQRKVSYSFVSFIMTLIGVPYALRDGRSSGVAMGIALSVFIGFIYWVLLSVGVSFGYANRLPPAAAAWFANVVFILAGGYLFLNVRQ